MKTLCLVLLAGLFLLLPCLSALAMDDRNHRGSLLSFRGKVDKLPIGLYGAWIIDGRRVLVTPQTRVDQNQSLAAPGSLVETSGFLQGNSFRATTIRIQPEPQEVATNLPHRHENGNFHGTINQRPLSGIGHWMIDEHRVMVDKLTRIEEALGDAVVGALVKVGGYYRNGTFYADWLRVK